ncbi:MAG: acyltransferase family protein [Actinomycetota bacterium]
MTDPPEDQPPAPPARTPAPPPADGRPTASGVNGVPRPADHQPPPRGPGAVAAPPPPGFASPHDPDRRNDLDALRGFAMLLGIGLHAAIPWFEFADLGESDWARPLQRYVEFVHGFRMPLFFLLSGYFTTLLWRRRGTRALIRHRLRRIGLPLVLFWLPLIILVIAAFVIGAIAADIDLEELDRQADYVEAVERGDADASDAVGQSETEAADDGDEFSFMHLWFLWQLLWLGAGLILVVAVAQRFGGLGRGRDPARVLLWVLPILAVGPQLAMTDGFGPDTSEGFIPAGRVLAYYAIFFGFGALTHGRVDRTGSPVIDAVGRRWQPLLVIGAVVVFPAALLLQQQVDADGALLTPVRLAAAVGQVLFCWMLCFGLLGLFNRYLSRPRFRTRYLSDASYWMYLAHLPLVILLQGLLIPLDLPWSVDFLLICVITFVVLDLSYRWLVRYTPVGHLLNGRRSRAADHHFRVLERSER